MVDKASVKKETKLFKQNSFLFLHPGIEEERGKHSFFCYFNTELNKAGTMREIKGYSRVKKP